MKVLLYFLVAWVLSLFMFISCNHYQNEDESYISDTVQQALHNLDATIEIRLTTGSSDEYCHDTPLKLCFKDSNNCYDIVRSGTTGNFCRDQVTKCYDKTTSCLMAVHAANGDVQSDHPFVDHPDDWDNLFIKAADRYILDDLIIEVTYSPPAAADWNWFPVDNVVFQCHAPRIFHNHDPGCRSQVPFFHATT